MRPPSPCVCPNSYRALVRDSGQDPCSMCAILATQLPPVTPAPIAERILDGLRVDVELSLIRAKLSRMLPALRAELLVQYPSSFGSRTVARLVSKHREQTENENGSRAFFEYSVDAALGELEQFVTSRLLRGALTYEGDDKLDNYCRSVLWGKHGEKLLVRQYYAALLIEDRRSRRGRRELLVDTLDEGVAPADLRPTSPRRPESIAPALDRDLLLERLTLFAETMGSADASLFLEFNAFQLEGRSEFQDAIAATLITDRSRCALLRAIVGDWRAERPQTPLDRIRTALQLCPTSTIAIPRGFLAWLAIHKDPGPDPRQPANPASQAKKHLAEAWFDVIEKQGIKSFRDPVYTILKSRR